MQKERFKIAEKTANENAEFYYASEKHHQGVYVSGFMHGFGYANDDDTGQKITDVEAAGVILKKLANVLEFIDAVDEMRHAQRSFFKERRAGSPKDAQEWLQRSKSFEKRVDELLITLRDKKPKPSTNQPSLF